MDQIPFNKPYLTGKESKYINEANLKCQLSGDGFFTNLCSNWLKTNLNTHKALLTHSCTAALEISAILANLELGDEIIMPSYTFVSTANAFVLRKATPVFVDIRADTLNIDETKIEAAITKKTRAIVPVHYAGIACEMDTIMQIAAKYGLLVIEDAAQAILAKYKNRYLGTIGDLGCFSFHATKNIVSGEGGALLINNSTFSSRAEIIREKGTDRSCFLRGEIDKYTWKDLGSSFLPSELIAAFLWAQLQEAEKINNLRIEIWYRYHSLLEGSEKKGLLTRPFVPKEAQINAHIYYVILPEKINTQTILERMKRKNIYCSSHYIPLHSSIAGKKYAKIHGDLNITNQKSSSVIRLPLWVSLTIGQQQRVVYELIQAIENS